MIVRGVCCLRPGIPGVSENIRVRSIVGRFLEHSRLYSFENAGNPEVLIGSADLMERNLNRRVETLCFVRDVSVLDSLRDDLLEVLLADNDRTMELDADGTYHPIETSARAVAVSAHEEFLRLHAAPRDEAT